MEKEVIKCPHCGGNRQQPLGGGAYKCLYCGSTFVCNEPQQGAKAGQASRPAPNAEGEEHHFLTINWQGTFALYDVKMRLNVNGTAYDNAYFVQGFTVRIPVEKTMAVTLASGMASSTFSLYLDPDCDYRLELDYSRMKGWFTSYQLSKKEPDGRYTESRYDIANDRKGTSFVVGCFVFIILFLLFFLIALSFL